jgi:hypothetical protein
MRVASDASSRARNLTLLALLALVAAIAAVGTGDAFARWDAAATQVTGGGHVRITTRRVVGLYPGARRRLLLTLSNTDRRRPVSIAGVRVSTVSTTKRGCKPSRRNLRIRPYRGPAFTIRPHSARRLSLRLRMPNTVANACQRAVFRLRYTALLRTTRVR